MLEFAGIVVEVNATMYRLTQCCRILLLLGNCFQFNVCNSCVSNSTFTRLGPEWSMTQVGPGNLRTSSLMNCAVTALQFQYCSTFVYISKTGQCILGLFPFKTHSSSTNTAGDIFVKQELPPYFSNKAFKTTEAYLRLFQKEFTFAEAVQACGRVGASLVFVKSVEKLDLLISLGLPFPVWIGAHDLAVEGTHVWLDDGSVIDEGLKMEIFFDPSGSSDEEDCVQFLPNINLLDNSNCSSTHYFICELPIENVQEALSL